MKYRKKPVVIDAMQLKWETWNEMCDFAGVGCRSDGKPEGCLIGPDGQPLPTDGSKSSEELGLLIPTSKGTKVARQGDWVIRGARGKLYLCKSDVFAATYESV